jgi:hypothetical protein
MLFSSPFINLGSTVSVFSLGNEFRGTANDYKSNAFSDQVDDIDKLEEPNYYDWEVH